MPFDELWFGKPHADVYIDDNAYRFTTWDQIADDGSNLPLSREKALARKLAEGAGSPTPSTPSGPPVQ